MKYKDSKTITIRVNLGENSKADRIGDRIGYGIVQRLNQFYKEKRDDPIWEDAELYFEDLTEVPNCRKCQYFISDPASDSCLKREDIGYKGTCIDGMDYYRLASNCSYY